MTTRFLSYAAAIVFLAISASCNNVIYDDCIHEREILFVGVIFTTETGTSTFARNARCNYFISGSDSEKAELRQAWKKSPYRSSVRPIAVRIVGSVRRSDQLKYNGIFSISKILYISENVNEHEVQNSAIDRFGPKSDQIVFK